MKEPPFVMSKYPTELAMQIAARKYYQARAEMLDKELDAIHHLNTDFINEMTKKSK